MFVAYICCLYLICLDLNQITANLVEQELGVAKKYLHVLPMGVPTSVPNPQGIPRRFAFIQH